MPIPPSMKLIWVGTGVIGLSKTPAISGGFFLLELSVSISGITGLKTSGSSYSDILALSGVVCSYFFKSFNSLAILFIHSR